MNAVRLCSLLLPAFLLVAGCDSNGSNDDDLAAGTVTAEIDGERFEATTAQATFVASGLGGQPSVTLIAFDYGGGAPSSLTITLLPFAAEGRYAIDGSNTALIGVGAGGTTSEGFLASEPGDGTIEVTEADEAGMRGTFSFTGRNDAGGTVRVTDGRFNVTFLPTN